jgi:hypothetical protein
MKGQKKKGPFKAPDFETPLGKDRHKMYRFDTAKKSI